MNSKLLKGKNRCFVELNCNRLIEGEERWTVFGKGIKKEYWQ